MQKFEDLEEIEDVFEFSILNDNNELELDGRQSPEFGLTAPTYGDVSSSLDVLSPPSNGKRKLLDEDLDDSNQIKQSTQTNPFAQLRKKIATAGDETLPTFSRSVSKTIPLSISRTDDQIHVNKENMLLNQIPQRKEHIAIKPFEQNVRQSVSTAVKLSAHEKDLDRFRDIPEGRAFKVARASNGTRLYFPFDRFNFVKKEIDAYLKPQANLLSKSVYRLVEEIEAEKLLKTKETVERQLNEKLNSDKAPIFENQLLVDKYRPRKYLDLLTDEWVNTQCISWLKQWDSCVYKTNKKIVKNDQQFFKDRLQRPDKKILMLAGPPGQGKTTLAHVIANQCGYNILEINASDERSGDAIQSKILNALQSKSSINNSKPNLIILDEIDGAMNSNGSNSLVSFLIKLVREDYEWQKSADELKTKNLNLNSSNDVENGKLVMNKKKGKKQLRKILRPIICICNDAYAMALKPLKPYIQMYNIKAPSINSISRRVRFIAQKEGIEVEKRLCDFLATKYGGDLRSTLNELQFLLQDADKINLQSIKDKKAEIKVSQSSVFQMWDQIFFGNKENKQEQLLNQLYYSQDQDMIINGCYEHAPLIPFRDLRSWGYNLLKVQEHLFMYDRVNSLLYGSGNSEGLSPYINYSILAFNYYCSAADSSKFQSNDVSNDLSLKYDQQGKPLLQFPRMLIDLRKTTDFSKSVFDSMIDSFIQKSKIKAISVHEFAQIYFSSIIKLLAVNVRGLNVHLLKQHELVELNRVRSVLDSFGITLKSFQQENGIVNYQFQPQIDQMAKYELMDVISQLPTSSAVRQLLIKGVSTSITPAPLKRLATNNTNDENNKDEKVIKKDFFGRVIEVQTVPGDLKTPPKQLKVVYKYHEGYSNAVRRKVTVRKLLNL